MNIETALYYTLAILTLYILFLFMCIINSPRDRVPDSISCRLYGPYATDNTRSIPEQGRTELDPTVRVGPRPDTGGGSSEPCTPNHQTHGETVEPTQLVRPTNVQRLESIEHQQDEASTISTISTGTVSRNVGSPARSLASILQIPGLQLPPLEVVTYPRTPTNSRA